MRVKGIIKGEQPYFEDVEEGAELPRLKKPRFCQSNQAAFMGVTPAAGFCAAHFDYGVAKQQFNAAAPYAAGAQVAVFLSQLLTNWIGPNGVLKRISYTQKDRLWSGFDGDQITIEGKVVRKRIEDGRKYVDCEIWAKNQKGTFVIAGSATVILPSRSDQRSTEP